jgi:hypothetical protein
MRGIFLLLTVLLVFGCTQPETPVENVTNQTNQTNITEPVCTGPVCGSDAVTYETDCDAIAANVSYTNGTCIVVEYNCTETDDGIEPKVAGQADFGEDSYFDYCINESHVLEYTCLDNEVANVSLTCDYGCEDGACKEPEPEPVETGCIGPIIPDVLKAEGVRLNGVNYNDVCVDYTTVKDYYCKDNLVKAQNSQCPPGLRCNLGACEDVAESCTETDVGQDIFTRGRTTHSKGLAILLNEWDECVDDGMVKEYYCSLDGANVTELECGSGYKCSGGKCVASDCSDTDDGFDIYYAGSTELYDKEYDDNCIDDYRLREYFCYGNDIKSDDLTCPEGYICHDDRCIEGEYD